jgi:hypothetical protein
MFSMRSLDLVDAFAVRDRSITGALALEYIVASSQADVNGVHAHASVTRLGPQGYQKIPEITPTGAPRALVDSQFQSQKRR